MSGRYEISKSPKGKPFFLNYDVFKTFSIETISSSGGSTLVLFIAEIIKGLFVLDNDMISLPIKSCEFQLYKLYFK